MFSPMSEVELLSNNSVITSRLPQLVKAAQHTNAIIDNILKQTGWSLGTFNKVNWEAHKLAITKHNRIHHISIIKLIQGLYQTKYKDHKYYGTPATCPCCQLHTETMKPLIHMSMSWSPY